MQASSEARARLEKFGPNAMPEVDIRLFHLWVKKKKRRADTIYCSWSAQGRRPPAARKAAFEKVLGLEPISGDMNWWQMWPFATRCFSLPRQDTLAQAGRAH